MKRPWRLLAALAVTALWICFIYARSAQPAEQSGEESSRWLILLRRLIPSISLHAVRKLAHFTEYWILGALLALDWRLWGRGGFWLPLIPGLAVAASDELLQTFIPGRSGQLSDVLLDCFGAACAVLPVWLLCRRKERSSSGTGSKTP